MLPGAKAPAPSSPSCLRPTATWPKVANLTTTRTKEATVTMTARGSLLRFDIGPHKCSEIPPAQERILSKIPHEVTVSNLPGPVSGGDSSITWLQHDVFPHCPIIWTLGFLSVRRGGHNKTPQTEGLNHRTVFSHSPGAGLGAGLLSPQAFLLGLQMAAFLPGPRTAFSLIPAVSSFSHEDTGHVGSGPGQMALVNLHHLSPTPAAF